jgi:diguanylate cyclase (GGDEF)-like protein
MPERTTILTVALDTDSMKPLLGAFESLGAPVQAVDDYLSAMGIVKSENIDLVVLGTCAGQLDVADMTRVLKSLRADRYTPVLVVAPKGLAADDHKRLLEAGVDDILGADLDAVSLACRIQAVLRLKSAYDQLRQVRAELESTLAREDDLLKQLRADNKNLKVRSITDGLTALYNYRYLMEWLKTEFKISRRYGHDLSMIVCDIDLFKRVNDEYGHPFGDYVLKEIAVILKQCARGSDLVARYAGDEFALVCPRTGRQEVRTLAKRILTVCRKHRFEYKGKDVGVTLSLGTATYPQDPEIVSPELIVFVADQALYQTKRTGRNGATAWHDVDAETRKAIRCELHGPGHPLLAEDPRSQVELAAAARLVGTAGAPTSLPLPHAENPSEP